MAALSYFNWILFSVSKYVWKTTETPTLKKAGSFLKFVYAYSKVRLSKGFKNPARLKLHSLARSKQKKLPSFLIPKVRGV